MGLEAALASLPEGYEVVRGRRGILAVERGSREALLGAGFGPDGGEELAPSDLAGRSPLGTLEVPGERWIVRRHRHGGLVRFLGEALFLVPARPFHELALTAALRARGLPAPRVVAARALRSGPLGWRLALVSARVEGALDAAEWLERLRRGELTGAERARLLAALGELVGRLHAARFLHADLHGRNLLVAHDLAAAWVLDLDRGRCVPVLGEPERRDNLRRLYRSVRRREARGRPFLRRADYLRFLRAYGDARGVPADWRADWRAIVARDRARAPFHRLGWFVEELLGAGPDRRDGAAVVR
jgi:hypothetical protein